LGEEAKIMKRIKSAVKIILCCLLCIGSASSLTSCSKKKTGELITRGEWAELLGSFFGMNQPMSMNSYFSDVSTDNPYFLYVQAEKEWELYEDENEFRPDENATWEFVIKSAVIASGELDSIEDPKERFEQALIYAKDQNLIKNLKKKTLRKEISKEDSVEIANWAANRYLNRDFVEYENVEVNDEVQNFSKAEGIVVSPVINEETGERTVVDTSGTLNKIKSGDVIIIPGDEDNPEGIAQKVIDVTETEDDQIIITTIEPELQEIYKALDFSVDLIPDPTKIITEPGVTLIQSTASKESDYTLLGDKHESGIDLTFSINFTHGKQVTLKQNYPDGSEFSVLIGENFQPGKIQMISGVHYQAPIKNLT
jgi:hypothetical protein